MKVHCKTNTYQEDRLTIDKWYDVIEEGQTYFRIVDDQFIKANWSKAWFRTMSESRERKLKELGV
jgi:hypothetical protein